MYALRLFCLCNNNVEGARGFGLLLVASVELILVMNQYFDLQRRGAGGWAARG